MDTAPTVEPIFQHSKRQEWGHAIQTWEGNERARFLFEDGKVRTFHRDYVGLLHPVDRSYDRARAIVRNLKTILRTTQKDQGQPIAESAPPAPRLTVAEQAAMLRRLFPEGFRGSDYQAQHRGLGKKRPAKKHRDPAIAFASEAFDRAALEAMIAKSDFLGLVEVAVSVLDRTDLAPKRETKLITPKDHEAARPFALALFDLLHGNPEEAFDPWVRALTDVMGRKPSWELATAPLALLAPSAHVAVKVSVFREQARWLSPTLRVGDTPSGDQYARLCEMAQRLRDLLVEKGLAPRDLLDVRDFMWMTLRPSAEALLLEVRAKAAKAVAA